jgi:hypothetical protein
LRNHSGEYNSIVSDSGRDGLVGDLTGAGRVDDFSVVGAGKSGSSGKFAHPIHRTAKLKDTAINNTLMDLRI